MGAASSIPRVIIVGTGSIGERHLRCFLETGRVQVAFVEIDDKLRGTIADRYRVPGFASLEAALHDCSAELAVIATPAHLHIPMATQLAREGLHLLIEKPLSTSLESVDELAALGVQKRLLIAVAYVYRSFPALASMREAIRAGRFGQPLQVVGVSGQSFPTYRPAYRETYYASHHSGGGAIQDALTHLINSSEWIAGPINRLVADAAHQKLAGVEVEDTVHVLARHGDILASYSLNQHQAPNESTLTVICEEGTARWEAHKQSWRWMEKPDTPWQEVTFEPQPRDAAFIGQAHQFLDAVEGKTEPRCSLAEGKQTLGVNLAILRSVQEQCWQTVKGRTDG